MIELVLLMAVMQPVNAPPAEQGSITQERNSVQLPPEIAPAVFPYFQCVMAAMNKEAETSLIATADAARAAQQRALANCQAVRTDAKAKAVAMLLGSKIGSDDREAFAEQALTSIDHAHDSIAERLERNAQKSNAED